MSIIVPSNQLKKKLNNSISEVIRTAPRRHGAEQQQKKIARCARCNRTFPLMKICPILSIAINSSSKDSCIYTSAELQKTIELCRDAVESAVISPSDLTNQNLQRFPLKQGWLCYFLGTQYLVQLYHPISKFVFCTNFGRREISGKAVRGKAVRAKP